MGNHFGDRSCAVKYCNSATVLRSVARDVLWYQDSQPPVAPPPHHAVLARPRRRSSRCARRVGCA